MKHIIISISMLFIVFLNCSLNNPSYIHGKEYFAGTWVSGHQYFNKFEFANPNARWFINYSDTISDPSQYIDSCNVDYVQDSFFVNDFKSWDINETDSTIILYDTCVMFSGNMYSETPFYYEILSNNQFYLKGFREDTNKILFTKY